MKLASVIFAGLFATVGSAHAVCTNGTLVGSYGSILYGGNGTYGVHLLNFVADGKGKMSGSETRSVGGSISSKTFTGTYSVSATCTGRFALTYPLGHTATGSFVIDHGQKGLEILITNSGYNLSGFALAQGTAACGLVGKPQIVAVNLAGAGGGHGVNTVGQAKLSGTGTLSGSTIISVGGTIRTYPVTGTYTMKADCTGNAIFTLKGLSTSNFALVSVNSGQELLMLETDSNTVVQGVMTQ